MAITYDATDDIIDLGTATALDDLTTFTFSVWLYITGSGEGTFGFIFDKRASDTTSQAMVFYMDGAATSIGFQWATDGTFLYVKTGAVWTNSVWAHMVWTGDGTLTATNHKCYRNGSETSYVTQTNGTGTRRSTVGGKATIGNGPTGTSTFQGRITEVALWSSVLSTTDISQLYGNGKGAPLWVSPSTLKGYWPMHEFTNGVTIDSNTGAIKDFSGNGNHGTQSGNPVAVTEPLIWPTTIKAMDFEHQLELRPSIFRPGIAR